MFAPGYHSAMKFVGPIRKKIGTHATVLMRKRTDTHATILIRKKD